MVVSLGMSRSLAGFELAHQRNPNMTATGDELPFCSRSEMTEKEPKADIGQDAIPVHRPRC